MKKEYFHPADILLTEADLYKWAVIACDQFTSEPDYWKNVESTVSDAPSALRITLPEIYLGDGDTEKRICDINRTMDEYLKNGVFKQYTDTMIYVEREQTDGRIRHGIVGAIDLDDYDYNKGSKALIRATEQTVLERIPPRVRIRKDAPIELPHAMLLYDDINDGIMSLLRDNKGKMKKAYDSDLMEGGGHIVGYFIPDELISKVQDMLSALVEKSDDKMLFAVGDGNHSLATAKECHNLSNCESSSRALVEIVNIHDSALEFEPIYRVLFGVDGKKLVGEFISSLGGEYFGDDAQRFTVVLPEGTDLEISVKPTANLPVGTLQSFLDKYLKEHGEAKIDYIHGIDSTRSLVNSADSVGFLFDGMTKNQLFDAVRADGSLPRKTFSMGHARDKRYYIEARKIR